MYKYVIYMCPVNSRIDYYTITTHLRISFIILIMVDTRLFF